MIADPNLSLISGFVEGGGRLPFPLGFSRCWSSPFWEAGAAQVAAPNFLADGLHPALAGRGPPVWKFSAHQSFTPFHPLITGESTISLIPRVQASASSIF
jgi:hypothetical protein